MKIRLCAVMVLAAMTASLFAGCGKGTAREQLNELENTVAQGLDRAEDAVESAVNPTHETAAPQTSEPSGTTQSTTAPALTREEAEEIALKDAGLTADQVTGLHTEYDVDDHIPEYDVEFHHGGWEYDYEIHADTGEILFKDKEAEH